MSALCSCTVKNIESGLDASRRVAAVLTEVWRCEDLLGHVLELLPRGLARDEAGEGIEVQLCGWAESLDELGFEGRRRGQ